MKKIFVSIIIAMLSLTLVACGTSKTVKNVPEKDEKATVQQIKPETEDENNTETASEKIEWKQFLKDYENWMEKYIEILKKYKSNPSDATVLADYTEILKELSEWQSKAEMVQKELEEASPAEVAEYSAEIIRIAGRIAEAAN